MKAHLTTILKTVCMVTLLLVTDGAIGQNLLNAPQKIVIDRKPGRIGYTRNRLLVSNYNNGSIVEIDTLGNQKLFMGGAGFVDGMEIVGNAVYGVGNNRKISGYDLNTKQQVMNLTLAGTPSDYLSSVTYDSLGHLLISCPNLNIIYRLRLSDNAYWVFAEGQGLNRPNGILLEKENDRIVVIDDSPGSSLIHAISLSDSTVSTLASTSFNSPDGIVRDKFGYYYIGGYYLPGLYTTDSEFSYAPQLFFSGQNMVYPTYDDVEHCLYITYYGTNSWDKIELTTTASSSKMLLNESNFGPVFPNPSSGDVTIGFELEVAARIKMEAYNSTGQCIGLLIDEVKYPGIHTFQWDCQKSGSRLPNGLYFIRLNIDGNIKTRQIVLTGTR